MRRLLLLSLLAGCAIPVPDQADPEIRRVYAEAEVSYEIAGRLMRCTDAADVHFNAHAGDDFFACTWPCATWDDDRAETDEPRGWALIWRYAHGGDRWLLDWYGPPDPDAEAGAFCDEAP